MYGHLESVLEEVRRGIGGAQDLDEEAEPAAAAGQQKAASQPLRAAAAAQGKAEARSGLRSAAPTQPCGRGGPLATGHAACMTSRGCRPE
jgi:hypothetical protein